MTTEREPITLTLTLTTGQADAVFEALLDARDAVFEALRDGDYETEEEQQEAAEHCASLDGAMAALRGAPGEGLTADEYRKLARE